MKDFGGKGRCPLWLVAGWNRPRRGPISIGFMLDYGDGHALLSFGAVPGFTIGIGWVTRRQRQLDAGSPALH